MTKRVVTATTLVTEDGVPIDAIHLPGPKDLAVIVAHGFTLSWQRPNVWRIANRFNRMAGVISFDFRGHGRSGGLSTLGDREIWDLDVAVAWARELGYQRVAAVGFSMGASVVLRQAACAAGWMRWCQSAAPDGGTTGAPSGCAGCTSGRQAPGGTLRDQAVAEDPDQPGRLASSPDAAGRGRREDRARAAADRAR